MLLFQLGDAEGEGLEHVCFAPLSSDDVPTVRKQCVVQSVWGFYQDDLDTFEETDTDPEGFTVNYLDQLKTCTQ